MTDDKTRELIENLHNARGGQNTGDIEDAMIALDEYQQQKLVAGLLAVESLIKSSCGVYGLPDSGDDHIPWHELRGGGDFASRLKAFDEAVMIARGET